MSSLYEIRAEIENIIDNCLIVDEETGEILTGMMVNDETGEYAVGDASERLKALQMQETEKIENIACFIKNLNAEAGDLKEEEKQLARRRKIKEKKAEYLKNYLRFYLRSTNKNKLETTRCALSLRRSSRVDILDAAAIEAYAAAQPEVLRYKEPEINKAYIGRLLKSGVEVPGAAMVETESLILK